MMFRGLLLKSLGLVRGLGRKWLGRSDNAGVCCDGGRGALPSIVVPAKAGTSSYAFEVCHSSTKPGVARQLVTFFAPPKKVTKKRRPQSPRPGDEAAGVPCASRSSGPLGNSPLESLVRLGRTMVLAAQTSLAEFPRRFCDARRVQWGKPQNQAFSYGCRPGAGRGPILVMMALALVACGTSPKPPASKPSAPARPGGYYLDDGPGENAPANLEAIPDAVPREEPLHRGANRPYTVFGRTYVPNVSNEPFRQQGLASWYGRKFHGNPTSIGEPYDMYGMTAAHPTLPLPSYVRVTNPANMKSVVVRVNDRGPFHSDRIIDLSFTAAAKLDLARRGSGAGEGRRRPRGRHAAAVRRLPSAGPGRWRRGRGSTGLRRSSGQASGRRGSRPPRCRSGR